MISPTENPFGRGKDPTGHGYYGAKRGDRKHEGFDLVSDPNDPIFSPIIGAISKIGYPYKDNFEFRYIEIKNKEYRVRLTYVKPNETLKVGNVVMEGDKIGTAQDIASHWGNGMRNHIHTQVWKHGLLTDPEPLFMKL